MCRSIKTLYNYEPAATDDDIHAAALQFVRKISGYRRPSKVNGAAFNAAIDEITHTVQHLLVNLHTSADRKHRI